MYRASRGDVAGEQRDEGQQSAYSRKRQWIVRAHAEKLIGHEPGERQSSGDADQHPQQCHSDSLAEDEAHDVAGLRAERHAYPDFMRALAHQMRDHAVNADAGKDQCERGERTEQEH